MRTLKEQIKEWKQKNKSSKRKPRKNKTRELTHKDFEELMGIHRPRYERRSGAIKQKGGR